MVRIINAFREDRPVGQVLANLGQALFGDMATGEVNRQQAYALQRSNAETDNLMNWMRTGQNLDQLSPEAAAMLVGSGYSPDDFGRIGNIFASTNYGARDDRTTNYAAGIGEYGNTAEAFDFDQQSQRDINDADNAAALTRQNALPLEALDANGNPVFTTQGATAGFAPVLTDSEQKGRIGGIMFPDMPPAQQAAYLGAEPQVETVRGPGGAPTIVARTDAIGQPAAVGLDVVRGGVAQDALGTDAGLGGLPDNEQAFVGADTGASTGTPKNYVGPDGTVHITYDGVNDAQTGTPLPPGGQIISTSLQGGAADIGLTNAATTDAQSDVVAATKFNAIVDMALPLTENGTLFGPVGWVRSKGQELLQSVRAAMDVVDPGAPVLNAETGEAAGTIAQFIPEMFDPQLSEVETLWGALLYQGASALAGQQGRSVSDADVRFMRTILGNPMGLFSSAASMRAKLLQAQAVVNALSNVSRDVLQNGVNTTPAAVAPPTAADVNPTAPTTGNLAPNPDGTLTWTP